jgi:DNA-binding Xre family transcriptional regulator
MCQEGTSYCRSMMFRMTTIAWRVGQLAAQRGWSTRRLAEAAGLDEKTVRNIIAGRATRVDLDTIARLSSTLGVPPGALWTSEPDPASAWMTTAGAAGQALPGELDEVLAGGQPDIFDSAIERATRSR